MDGSRAAIPFLRVSGTHREVGRQVGASTAEIVRRAAAAPFEQALVERYRAAAEHLPWLLEELDGVAEGARVDPFAVFAASILELADADADADAPAPRGCTDLVVMAEASADGHLLVAHNNDYLAESEREVVAIEWRVPGEPVCFTLGLGPWLAAGWNDAGLSVTVTALEPADARVGIPRLLQLRDAATRRTVADALEAVLHPARASSYNWLLAHRDGGAVNVEATARRAEISEPERGLLAHTNHYTDAGLLELERNPNTAGSATRLGRARELLAAQKPWTVDGLRRLLCDHENAPDSLCRHGQGEEARTIFWCVADVTARSIRYGLGPPCTSDATSYHFEP